jgi:hypothetical protein
MYEKDGKYYSKKDLISIISNISGKDFSLYFPTNQS